MVHVKSEPESFLSLSIHRFGNYFVVYVIFFFYTIMTEKFHVRIFCLKCQKTESLWGRITHLKTSLQALINSNYWPLTYDTSLDIRSSRTFLCIKHFYFKYMSTFSWLYFDFQGHRINIGTYTWEYPKIIN